MSHSIRPLSIIAALSVLASTMACSGGATGSDSADPSADNAEGALVMSSLVPGTIAIRMSSNQVAHEPKLMFIAQKSKVTKVLGAFKKLQPDQSLPRCIVAETIDYTFYDENAKELGQLTTSCGAGTLKVGSTTTKVLSDGTAGDVMSAPIVPADALWGITKVDVLDRAVVPPATVTITNASQIAKIIDGIDLNQKIDTTAPRLRCLPTHTVTFRRPDDTAALASYICDGDESTSLPADFSVPRPNAAKDAPALISGSIKLDPRPIKNAVDAQRAD